MSAHFAGSAYAMHGAGRSVRIIGAALVLLGGGVMLGWIVQAPAVVRVLPGATPMVFSTALGFALLGLALFLAGTRFAHACAAAAGALALAVLGEHGFSVSFGIDWPGLHQWLKDGNPAPGRTSAPTAGGFLMASAALLIAPRARVTWQRVLTRGLILATGLVGLLALAGYAIEARLLFPDYVFGHVALHTAAGLTLLSAGAWRACAGATRAAAPMRDEDRITLAGALVLVAAAAAVGLASFSELARRARELVVEDVQRAHRVRSQLAADLIEQREDSAQLAAARRAVIGNLRAIGAGRGGERDRANVAAVAGDLVKEGFGAVAYLDAGGREVARAGSFAEPVAERVQLATPERAELLWKDGYVLRHRIPMRDAEGTVGEVVAEQPMQALTRLLFEYSGIGESWDLGLCARRGDRLHCFPQRLKPEAFTTPLQNVVGEPLPMTRALRGESGVVFTRDYRAREVIAAYGPVGALGLGMVVKIDSVEILRPLRGNILGLTALLLAIVATGIVLLRAQVRPTAAALVEANRAKDRFLAAMSHELRTPLNAIIGFTGTLLMRLPGPLNPDQEKQLRTVQLSGRHLLSLINDLLDLSKIEAGKLEFSFERVDLAELIEEIAATLRPLADEKRLELRLAPPAQPVAVSADRRALSQIMLNLAGNAIKFTEKGGVRIAWAERDSGGRDLVEISVEDTGIGIALQNQDRLFSAFGQLDPETGRTQGSGLGLHLSQRLAGMLGGRIVFTSEAGKGSTFTLQLERQPA